MEKGKIAGGIILLILGAILTSFCYTINNQCSSFGGQVGSFFSTEVQSRCSLGGVILVIGVILTIVGLVLIIVGAVSQNKRNDQHSINSTMIFADTVESKSSFRRILFKVWKKHPVHIT